MKVIVAGQGILGLSTAEFLSRSGCAEVQVIAADKYPAASLAAAANLSTKGQAFARDPHFNLKIQGKQKYAQWLVDLRHEIGVANFSDLTGLFMMGRGRDVFFDSEDCLAQWRRVQQPAEEIAARGFSAQKIERPDSHTIEYGDEAWVDAQRLLNLLEAVCRQRGVRFSHADFLNPNEFSRLFDAADHFVLATGAQTLRILAAWDAPQRKNFFRKARRWSYGGTLEIRNEDCRLPEGITLLEVCPVRGPLSKLTFSGTNGRIFCSSISVKCQDQDEAVLPKMPNESELEEQQQIVFDLVQRTFGFDPRTQMHNYRWGLRLGFGHSELVVESLPVPAVLQPKVSGSFIVAAGAHKSGFLFAPCIGELVMQKMQRTTTLG